jgi:hypothetical protein
MSPMSERQVCGQNLARYDNSVHLIWSKYSVLQVHHVQHDWLATVEEYLILLIYVFWFSNLPWSDSNILQWFLKNEDISQRRCLAFRVMEGGRRTEYTSFRSLISGSAAANRISMDDASGYRLLGRARVAVLRRRLLQLKLKVETICLFRVIAHRQEVGQHAACLQRLQVLGCSRVLGGGDYKAPSRGMKAKLSYKKSRASSNSRDKL